MKGLTPQERRDSLKGLVNCEAPAELPLLDRSTAQNWSDCPWMAKEVEEGRGGPVGMLAESGEAIHQCLSAATQAWIDSSGAHTTADLRSELEHELRRARPDIQPDVLKGCMPSVWAWANFLTGGYQGRMIHPHNIMRFDGGEDNRCGQLAMDIPDLGVRVTSEIDLLLATDSEELVDEVDYKGGHNPWWCDDVADAFQFQFHAVLIFENYPPVNAVRTRVWCTRLNRITHSVVFSRNRKHNYEVRLRSALETRRQHYDNPPTWPASQKCALCQVAVRCPVADESLRDLESDPSGYLKKSIAVAARLAAMQEAMAAYVDKTKQEIVCGSTRFGRQRPKQVRKSPAEIYEVGE